MDPLQYPTLREDAEGRVICEICERSFLHLASHVWHGHGIRANEYRDMQGLPYSVGLVAKSTRQKLVDHIKKQMASDPEKVAASLEKGRTAEVKARADATYSRRVGGGILDMSRGGIQTFTCVMCGVAFDGSKSASPKHCPDHVAEYQRRSGWNLYYREQRRLRDPEYRERRKTQFQEALGPYREQKALIHHARMLAAVDLYHAGYLVGEVASILELASHTVTKMLHEAGLGDLRGKGSNRSRRREVKPPPV